MTINYYRFNFNQDFNVVINNNNNNSNSNDYAAAQTAAKEWLIELLKEGYFDSRDFQLVDHQVHSNGLEE